MKGQIVRTFIDAQDYTGLPYSIYGYTRKWKMEATIAGKMQVRYTIQSRGVFNSTRWGVVNIRGRGLQ